jgi:hypothetical protein
VVAALARSERERAEDARLLVRPLEPPAPLSADAGTGRTGADLRSAAQDGLGSEADRGRARPPSLDGLEDAQAQRLLRARAEAEGAGQPVRVAVSGDLLHMDSTSYARFERPGHAVTSDRSTTGAERRTVVGYDYAHALVETTPGSLTPSCCPTNAPLPWSPSPSEHSLSSRRTGSARGG